MGKRGAMVGTPIGKNCFDEVFPREEKIYVLSMSNKVTKKGLFPICVLGNRENQLAILLLSMF